MTPIEAVIIKPIGNRTFLEGNDVFIPITVTDAKGNNISAKLTVSGLEGLTIDQFGIKGTIPAQTWADGQTSKEFNVTVTAEKDGIKDSQTFTITVNKKAQ